MINCIATNINRDSCGGETKGNGAKFDYVMNNGVWESGTGQQGPGKDAKDDRQGDLALIPPHPRPWLSLFIFHTIPSLFNATLRSSNAD